MASSTDELDLEEATVVAYETTLGEIFNVKCDTYYMGFLATYILLTL
jgi:hypothetical protein